MTDLKRYFKLIFQWVKKIISIWHVCVCVYVNIVKRYSFFGVLKTSGSNTNAHELNTSNYWCQQQFQFSFSLSDFVVDCDVVKFKQKSFVQSIFIPSYFPIGFLAVESMKVNGSIQLNYQWSQCLWLGLNQFKCHIVTSECITKLNCLQHKRFAIWKRLQFTNVCITQMFQTLKSLIHTNVDCYLKQLVLMNEY